MKILKTANYIRIIKGWTNSLPVRQRGYNSNVFDSHDFSPIKDRKKAREDSGYIGSYGLSELIQDRPNVLNEIKQYLINNSGVDAMTTAKSLGVAPSHVEEVAESIGISIERGSLQL